jgi:hypothetical protein
MYKPARLTAVLVAAFLVAACGRVRDPQVELDADAPPGDRDATIGNGEGDGGDTGEPDSGTQIDACATPPTPRCGEPVDETCPPRRPTELADVFPELEPLGVLLPTTVLEDEDGFRPSIATATAPIQGGGYGTGLLLAMRLDGRPVRLDLPLDDLPAAQEGALPFDDDDLANVGAATSVAAHRVPDSPQRIALHLGDSAGDQAWRGFADLVTLETRLFRSELIVFDDVGGAANLHLTRRRAAAAPQPVILEAFTAVSDGPPFGASAEEGVPEEENLRMLTTTSSVVLLQDGLGRFWFWRSNVDGEPVGSLDLPASDGKAAWVEGRDDYLIAHHRSGAIEFVRVDCPAGGFPEDNSPCALSPIVSPPATVSTLAPRGEVPHAVRLPDDRVAVLITERYDEGDRLVLQVVEAGLTSITLPRIELLDVRAQAERIADARIELVETSAASTLVVTAAVGRDENAADRVLVTGVRACPE